MEVVGDAHVTELPKDIEKSEALKYILFEERVRRLALEAKELERELIAKADEVKKAEAERVACDQALREKYRMKAQDSIWFDTDKDLYQIMRK